MKKKLLFTLALTASLLQLYAQNNKPEKIIGTWLSQEKDAKIEVYKQGEKYYGKEVWGKFLYEKDGKTPVLDVKNPDDKLKSRPLKDLVILTDFVYKDGEYTDGKIYNYKNGGYYKSYLKLDGDNILKLRGYLGISLLGKTTTWTRVL